MKAFNKIYLLGILTILTPLSPYGADNPLLFGLEEKWKPILEQFNQINSLESSFREKRYRPFKRIPTTLNGTLRIHPQAGISFLYTDPSFFLLHFHQGKLFRKKEDSDLEALDYPEVTTTMNWLSQIFAWNTDWLKDHVTASGEFKPDSNEWHLSLKPIVEAPASIDKIILYGSQVKLKEIHIFTAPRKRIEIKLRESTTNPNFSDNDIESFFPAFDQ